MVVGARTLRTSRILICICTDSLFPRHSHVITALSVGGRRRGRDLGGLLTSSLPPAEDGQEARVSALLAFQRNQPQTPDSNQAVASSLRPGRLFAPAEANGTELHQPSWIWSPGGGFSE